MWRRILGCAVALSALFAVVPIADAQTSRPSRPVRTAEPRVDILVHGAAQTVHWVGAQGYVEGRMGQRYVIRVHNPTHRRVEAVVSVDGRDAIDGRPASVHKRGYVISPYGYVDIDGFRLNERQVAAFRFTTVADSYAGRMGSAARVGRIDVRLFAERQRPRYRPPVRERAADAAPGRTSKAPEASRRRGQGLGTEFGERRSSRVRETHFERQHWSRPTWQTTVRYDDRAGLCDKGVRALCPVQPPYDPPVYAEPPPGWHGWHGYRRR